MQASLSASFTRTAPLRVRTAAKPRDRVAMRAVAYDKKSKGKPSLVGVIKVPKHFEHEMDALVVSHEAHMHDTHVVYNGQEAEEGRPRFLEYYVTKINEVEDPLDTKGTSPPRLPGPSNCNPKSGKNGAFSAFQSTSAGSSPKNRDCVAVGNEIGSADYFSRIDDCRFLGCKRRFTNPED